MRLDRQETRAAPQSHKALRLKQIIPYDPFHSLFIRLRHIESSTAITTATKTIATPQTKALRNPICSKLIKSQPTIAKRAVDSRLIKKRRSDIFSRRFSIARLYLAKVNYLKELRDSLDTEALQELQEFLAETMDRHDTASAVSRDDRKVDSRRNAPNLNTAHRILGFAMRK